LIFEGELGVYASIGHAIAPEACIVHPAFNMPWWTINSIGRGR